MEASVLNPPRVEETSADPLRDALVDAVGSDYEIVRLIGRGGMGAVYLARDKALERLVAIKVLPPGSATDAGVLERFRREAKTVASLQHVGIVPLYAFGERRGLCWFVMGYVRGESLASRLERDMVFDPDTARTMLSQVADALDHAHKQGIVHRDIKPDNILIDDTTGRPMLTDFGIARADTLSAGTSLTQVGSVMGTPHYMSPEQATAEPNIDGRSDLYSVGVVGYQMLSGQLPFDGRSFRELLMQHVSATPKPLATIAPNVPVDLADGVMRCLEKDPAKRFPDARSLRHALGGEAFDDETLGYQLAELRHVVAYMLMLVVAGLILGTIGVLKDWSAPGMPSWSNYLLPLMGAGYLFKVREARQRGFEWSTITRVMTLPPKWWFMWWPRSWRRSGDVYERLPRNVKIARSLNTAVILMALAEIPLLAWCVDDSQLELRTLAPPTHAFYAVRWLAGQSLLTVLLLLLVFLAVYATCFIASYVMAVRAGKPLGLSTADSRRLTYKPTDSLFFRDPRIVPMLRGSKVEQKPTTAQEFVSQILAATGRLTPASGTSSVESPVAARRLQDAIAACEREAEMLEKAAPREQIERIEAELVMLEAEQADPELISLLEKQRTALLRSRERLQLLFAKRDSAAAALEMLWSDVRRLANATDAGQLRELAEKVSAQCRQVQEDFPPRKSRTTTATGAITGALLFVAAGGLAIAAQPAGGSIDTARALLSRDQPDSALTVLQGVPTTSAERYTLTGLAHLERGHERSIPKRVGAAKAALDAFQTALARDSMQIQALEGLVWSRRLLPWFLGGRPNEVPVLLAALDRRAPYRGALLRGYFARLDKRDHLADSLFRALTVAHPDSAPAWFALGTSARSQNKADEARRAFQRYRTLMPDDPSVLYWIGSVSAESGVALDEGEQALRAYLAMPERLTLNSHADVWWRLGQIAEKRGRIAEARTWFTKAAKQVPRDDDFRLSLDSLEMRSRK